MKTMKIGEFYVHTITKTSVNVGCTKVTKAQIQRLLKLMANPPKTMCIGAKVKVVREIGDSGNVLGLTGKVVMGELGSKKDILVRFPDFTKGHGEGRHEWYVKLEALSIVR